MSIESATNRGRPARSGSVSVRLRLHRKPTENLFYSGTSEHSVLTEKQMFGDITRTSISERY